MGVKVIAALISVSLIVLGLVTVAVQEFGKQPKESINEPKGQLHSIDSTTTIFGAETPVSTSVTTTRSPTVVTRTPGTTSVTSGTTSATRTSGTTSVSGRPGATHVAIGTTTGLFDADAGNDANLLLRRSIRHEKQKRRLQRIVSEGRRACSFTKSILYEATDVFGDAVQIAPKIGDEENAKQQTIYETYCAEDHCSCRGVNTLFFESSCETTRQTMNARIIKAGKISWGSVYVRVGCSCIVRQKKHSPKMFEAIAA